jgi:hypothetical protein
MVLTKQLLTVPFLSLEVAAMDSTIPVYQLYRLRDLGAGLGAVRFDEVI